MWENTSIHDHAPESSHDPGWAAEDERINDLFGRKELPDGQESQKSENLIGADLQAEDF